MQMQVLANYSMIFKRMKCILIKFSIITLNTSQHPRWRHDEEQRIDNKGNYWEAINQDYGNSCWHKT